MWLKIRATKNAAAENLARSKTQGVQKTGVENVAPECILSCICASPAKQFTTRVSQFYISFNSGLTLSVSDAFVISCLLFCILLFFYSFYFANNPLLHCLNARQRRASG